jgi:hypothetical protein
MSRTSIMLLGPKLQENNNSVLQCMRILVFIVTLAVFCPLPRQIFTEINPYSIYTHLCYYPNYKKKNIFWQFFLISPDFPSTESEPRRRESSLRNVCTICHHSIHTSIQRYTTSTWSGKLFYYKNRTCERHVRSTAIRSKLWSKDTQEVFDQASCYSVYIRIEPVKCMHCTYDLTPFDPHFDPKIHNN